MDESKNPWTIQDERAVYDNAWINVTEYDVINPSGGKGIYGKVHFKNTAIGIMVLDAEYNTYLVGQYRFTTHSYSWEIPEGGGALDKNPLDEAARELLEETGLVATAWQQLLQMHLSNSVSDEGAIIFLARGLQQHTPCPEATEQLVVKKIPFSHALQMVNEGSITDSMSVAAILKVQLMLITGSLV